MNAQFTAWLAGLTNDDGTGNTGDLMNVAFFTDLLDLIDQEMTISGGMISTNTTYYVSDASGDDTTGDGSVLLPWATLGHALDVLRPYRIKPGVTVTIQLDDGTYTETSPIENLPEGILITGKNTVTCAVTSIQSSSGTAGNYSIILNVDSVVDITTSDFVKISAASGGTTPLYVEGVWQITNVDAVNTRITVNSTHTVGVPSGAVSATATVYKSNIYFIGCNGVTASVSLTNLCLRGDNTASTYGLYINDPLYIQCVNVGIRNFGSIGIFIGYSGSGTFTDCGVCSNGSYGVCAQYGGTCFFDGIISGNGSYGMYCLTGASMKVSADISGNTTYGMYCRYASVLYVLSGTITDAIRAAQYGYISLTAPVTYSTVSPAVNTQGNEYGYIDT